MVIRNTPLSQRGSAIVLALGVTALVVVLSVAMLTALSSDMKRTQKMLALDTQHSLLYAAESRALTLLNAHSDDEEETSLDQMWAVPWQYEQHEMRLQAQLFDEQSRFNVNSLKRKKAPKDDFSPKAVFERLTESINLGDRAPVLTEARDTWQPWIGISQLKPVLGPDFLKLMPFITAHNPKHFAVNVNTVSPIVLSAVLDISLKDAETLVASAPYASIESFDAALGQMELSIDGEAEVWLTVDSQHFILRTQIKNKRTFEFYTVFENGKEGWHVVQRSQGGIS